MDQTERSYELYTIYLVRIFKNLNHDKVTMQYVDTLVEERDRELAIVLLEKLLQRNTTYNPAKRLLDKKTRSKNEAMGKSSNLFSNLLRT
ncbi:hypothetical protein [Bacillus alkalicellulosilyticus]|uniref:hypothetical protein n=1 Tax=Alkalihalobacterium alkalicellulosilyticum TaxID=1912214 RepID=UPI000997A69E|nr:hypothetical protein [Bacillus alkalicellulosilyticus]